MDQKKLLVWHSSEMKKPGVERQVVDFATKRPSKQLLAEIKKSLRRIQGYGSVEIIIQNHHVVQISERNIKKTLNNNLNRS